MWKIFIVLSRWSMKKIYEYAHDWIEKSVNNNDIVVDFTMGNGNDTLRLAKMVPDGKVYGFDIQEKALNTTKEKLEKEGITNYELILDSHIFMNQYINKYKAGIFNLGYLPSGDKSITTKKKTTKLAVMHALDLLEVKGILAIVVYPGHAEGKLESQMLEAFVSELDNQDFDVMKLSVKNKKNAPYILIIEKNRPITF